MTNTKKKGVGPSWPNPLFLFGSPARTRTTDPMVNSHLLYRLSYWGTSVRRRLLNIRERICQQECCEKSEKPISSFFKPFDGFGVDRKTRARVRMRPLNRLRK